MHMEQIKYEFILEAAQPIAHHEGSIGNHATIARRKVRQADGTFAKVPIVSGDTMRHGLREAGTYALLDAAGMLGSTALTEAALRLLFSGGQITGSAGDGVKLGEYHEMCELIPPLALLGGCAQNRVVPGRLQAEDATLICAESERFVGEWALSQVTVRPSGREHVEVVQRVRMDPTLDPGKARMLGDGEQLKVQQRLLASENASEMGDDVAADKSKSTMLPRTFERIAQGSLFHWSVMATCYTPIDRETMTVTCAAFLNNCRVGGKRGTGHGLFRVVAGREIELARPSETIEAINPHALAARSGSLFRSHVAARKDRIAAFLGAVVA